MLAGQAASAGFHAGSSKTWFWVITVIAVAVAIFGYDLIHRFERYLTYATVAALAFLTVAALFRLTLPADAWNFGHFSWVPFLAQLGVAAGYQISWAIYVSDYSRYLPPSVTVRGTFRVTYWGSAAGGIWMMALGTLIAAAAGKNFDTVGSLKDAADKLLSGAGSVVSVIFALGLASVMAINMYGGSLTLISSIDSLRRVRPTVALRVSTVLLTAVLSLYAAYAASANFLTNFNNFLLLVLYFFIPWTAINLTDYFLVRRGHYAILEIFKPKGIYGTWGWPGIVSYLLGFAVMVPFFSVGTLFTGAVASRMGGADISLFVGLPVSALLYWVLTRGIDVAGEQRLAAQQATELEADQAA